MSKTIGIYVVLLLLTLLHVWWSNTTIDSLKEDVLEKNLTIERNLATIATIEKNNQIAITVLTDYYETVLTNVKASEIAAEAMVAKYLEQSKKKPEKVNVTKLTEHDLSNIGDLVGRMHEVYRSSSCSIDTRCID